MSIALSGAAINQRGRVHEGKLSDTRDGLNLSIELDGESYHLDDVAKLKITLKNVSQTPITVFKKFGWGPSSSFIFSISDDRGKEIERTAFADSTHWPPFSKEDFATLEPGESIQQDSELDLEGEEVKVVGVYHINIWYHSPIPRRSAPEVPNLWSAENGTLRAKPVRFKVTK
jgi:hypothetical protein